MTDPPATAPRFALVAAETEEAQAAKVALETRYDTVVLEEAEVVVALGGDGLMLETLHGSIARQVPIYGMNRGTVGFLMNQYHEDDLPERLARAERVTLRPLKMTACQMDGRETEAIAINEVALFRETRQAVWIRILVDGVERMPELICDGILLSTPAGSTAYNFSAHGPIVPIGAPLLALTPISAFRPRRWRGALLPDTATVVFEVLDPVKRPCGANADFTEVRDIARVEICEDKSRVIHLLFDPEHNLEQRILQEQFQP
ncbi:MAG: NAD kinase [Pseudomonadota bacterium]